MSEFDEQLRRLVIEACSHPPGSLKRQRALTQVIRLAMRKLWKDSSPTMPMPYNKPGFIFVRMSAKGKRVPSTIRIRAV